MSAPILVLALWFAALPSAAVFLEEGGAAAGEGYRSPLDLAVDREQGLIYITQATANRVAVFRAAEDRVVREIPLPDPPGGLALSGDGTRLYVTAAVPDGKVHVVDTASGGVIRTVTAGHTPCAPVLHPEGGFLYVCNRFENTVSVIDLKIRVETASVAVTREPVAAAITPDGRRLFVANHLPAGPADGDFVAAEVTLLDTRKGEAAGRVALPNGSTGLRGICLSPDGRHAFVTHLLARYHLPTTQLERGWINTNALSVIDVKGERLLNTVLLDDVELGAANPWGAACTHDGAYLVVTHGGGNAVSLIDLPGLLEKLNGVDVEAAEEVPNDLAFLGRLRRRVNLDGAGPRGLALFGGRAYAAEYFTGSLGVVALDPEHPEPARSIPLGEVKAMTPERRGEMLFNDAAICFQQWQSCASCHPDGRTDGLNWDLLNDGFGNPKNTRSMLLAHRTPPSMAMGIRGNAEVSVRAGLRHILFAERPEEEARAIDRYLESLEPVPSPYLVKGTLSRAARRGKEVFEKAGCLSCHPPALYTDLKAYDVGTTGGLDEGAKLDTPTLVEVWRTAPYLYDGRAGSMRSVLREHNRSNRHGDTAGLTPGELADLIEYVLSL